MVANHIVLEVSPVRRVSAQPWKVGFSVSLHNSVDSINNFREHNSDDILGYVEREDLEKLSYELLKVVMDVWESQAKKLIENKK